MEAWQAGSCPGARNGASMPAMTRPTLTLLALTCPSLLSAQATPEARGLLPVDHPACSAWSHEWASGGVDYGLSTYGTAASSMYGAAGREDGFVSLRTRGVAAVGLDWEESSGPVRAGATLPGSTAGTFFYPGPAESDDPPVAVRARGELSQGHLMLAADVSAHEDGVRTRVLALGVRAGGVLAYGGALGLRTGPGCRGGLVLGASDLAEAWGLELRQRTPRSVPWIGTLQVGTQLGVLREAGPGNRWPLFHSMRIELRPAHDWVVGLNRAVIFGGSETTVRVRPRTVVLMLIGLTEAPGKNSSFENQVASVDVRWRARARSRPVLVTAEYGTDDSGYAFLNVPGFRVTGELSLGAERGWAGLAGTWLTGSRDTYPPWSRHKWLAWGWTDRGRSLGNPLGGQVKALLGTFRKESDTAALELAVGVVDRGAENLFAPDLEGVGFHGSGSILWTLGGWEVSVAAAADVAGASALRWSSSVMRSFGRARSAP